MSIVLPTQRASVDFLNSLKSTVEEWRDRAQANVAAGTYSTRRNFDTLAQLVHFLGSVSTEDPRVIGMEAANLARGHSRTSYEPAPLSHRLFASVGVTADGIAHSNDELFNEWLACELAGAIDAMAAKVQTAAEAQARAEAERDELVPVIDHRDRLIRETDRLSGHVEHLEAELREANQNLEYLRAALPTDKPKMKKAAAAA